MKELIVAATCFVGLICCPNASLGAQPIENAESFHRLAFEPLPANSWKMFSVGANDQMLNLPYGRSYYAAVALPSGSGTLELRMQQPPIPFAGIKCIMACATFLDQKFRITRAIDSKQAYLAPGTFRPLENPLFEMRVEKKATDQYILLHTDASLVGKRILYDFPIGVRPYTPTAKGHIRVKFFPSTPQ